MRSKCDEENVDDDEKSKQNWTQFFQWLQVWKG